MIEIKGANELIAALEAMKATEALSIVRVAMGRALKSTVRAAKAGAPVESGLLKKSIGLRVKAYRKTQIIWAGVSARGKFGKEVTLSGGRTQYRVPTKYVHLAEKGTSRSSGRHFLQRAYASNQVASTMGQEVGKRIAEVLKKKAGG